MTPERKREKTGIRSPMAALPLALFAAQAWAHPPMPEGMPVNGALQVDSGSLADAHVVYGGYGYIGQSEAEAYESLQADCSASQLAEDRRAACELPQGSGRGKPWSDEIMETLVLQDLQRHHAELLIFQLRALGATSIKLPTCVSRDDDLKKLSSRLPKVVPRTETLLGKSGNNQKRLGRYLIATTPLRSDEMIRALLFHDKMVAEIDRTCPKSNQPTPSDTSECADRRDNLNRIRTSFPAILSEEHSRRRDKLRGAIKELLGSRIQVGSMLNADSKFQLGVPTRPARQAAGYLKYQTFLASSDKDALPSLESQIADALHDAAKPSSSQNALETSALMDSRDHLNLVLVELRKQMLDDAKKELSHLCDRRSVETFLKKMPNIVRQAMNDASAGEQARMRVVLCGSKELVTASRQRSCDGVSRLSDEPGWSRVVEVNRQDCQYPYCSEVNYKLREPVPPPQDKPVEIETTIRVSSDASITRDALNRKIAEMEQGTNAFYACMSGDASALNKVPGMTDRKKCPPDPAMLNPPRVRYKVRFEVVPEENTVPPRVRLHQCFNADLPDGSKTDCNAAREHYVKSCRDSIARWKEQGRITRSTGFPREMGEFLENISLAPQAVDPKQNSGGPDFLKMSDAQAASHCESQYPPDAGRYNRENSGNYTVQTRPSTVIHEVGHALGLPDEYQDPTYPFLPQGEHDSIMNHSSCADGRIFKRHLAQTLEPLQCASAFKKSWWR